MKYLFISGAANSGKTSCIIELYKKLISEYDFHEVAYKKTYNSDFIGLIEKNNTYILINSASDGKEYINQLSQFKSDNVEKKHIELSAIITSLRDKTESIRDEFKEKLSIDPSDSCIDIPKGRARTGDLRKASCDFLDKETIELAILILGSKPPFNLLGVSKILCK